jgi:hypothetical protein
VSSHLQQQRFEFKYHLSEAKARRVREFVHAHLKLDEYSVGRPNFSYPTLSLYLDSDALDTYWHTIGGYRNRFKLRLRYYDERPDTPVFFEIKRRAQEIILKKRGAVRKSSVRRLLAGHEPAREDLFDPNDDIALADVQRFCSLMRRLKARPKMHVAYMREAYENPSDNTVRVTFDRQVEGQPNPTARLIAKSPRPHVVFGQTVILELKFTNSPPAWFHQLVTTFDCLREGAAKYADGIVTKGEDWVHRGCSPERLTDEFLAAENYPALFESSRAIA